MRPWQHHVAMLSIMLGTWLAARPANALPYCDEALENRLARITLDKQLCGKEEAPLLGDMHGRCVLRPINMYLYGKLGDCFANRMPEEAEWLYQSACISNETLKSSVERGQLFDSEENCAKLSQIQQKKPLGALRVELRLRSDLDGTLVRGLPGYPNGLFIGRKLKKDTIQRPNEPFDLTFSVPTTDSEAPNAKEHQRDFDDITVSVDLTKGGLALKLSCQGRQAAAAVGPAELTLDVSFADCVHARASQQFPFLRTNWRSFTTSGLTPRGYQNRSGLAWKLPILAIAAAGGAALLGTTILNVNDAYDTDAKKATGYVFGSAYILISAFLFFPSVYVWKLRPMPRSGTDGLGLPTDVRPAHDER